MNNMEPIAVIGFSFKMAQEAIDEGGLWEVLQNRRNLMTEWPENRITLDAFYDGGSRKNGTVVGRGGCFMTEDPKAFDASFFSIMPKEASAMDPQQRWLLETSYHAFENAGLTVEDLKNSNMAVFEASMSDDYIRMHSKDPGRMPAQSMTGNAGCVRPNRVSWHFGLLGPSIHVDTACSGSLVAMDMACQSIRNGDADSALVLGCNLMLGPEVSIGLGNQGFLSPSSVCHSFDHRADGYGRGEGFVAMVVKPLSKAIADGNMIRAVIRGTGSNSDGHTASMTQPSAEAQERLIRHVYGKAGLDFDSTRYFEAHGTGTPAGDPIEMRAIGRVFRTSRSTEDPLYVGSIKANVGHVEGGAGLAGVVKAVMVLEKGVIPPNALFEKLNPDIDAEFYHTAIPVKSTTWPSTGVRRVSVNSFGMGGANSHVVLDDALSYLAAHSLQGNHQTVPVIEDAVSAALSRTSSPAGTQSHNTPSTPMSDDQEAGPDKNKVGLCLPTTQRLVVWSANDEAGIGRVGEQLKSYYATKALGSHRMLDRLAFTLAARRTPLSWRSFAVVDGSDVEGSLIPAVKPIRSSDNLSGPAFIFTGQGAQYLEMGLELVQYPVFMKTLECIQSVFDGIGCEWNILDELRNKETINRPEYTQPLCTALQISLTELLKEFGITPVAVAGHSSGEIAAAYATSALTLESAAKVAYYRGSVAGKLRAEMASSSSTLTPGAMMSVNLNQEQAEEYILKALEATDPEKSVHVACINSPTNCTLSGAEIAIDTLKALLDTEGIFAQKFDTGKMAYHSPMMKRVASDYLESLKTFLSGETTGINYSEVHMSSSVTGAPISSDELSDPQYWVDNLVSPVKFVHAVTNMMSEDTKVEIANMTGGTPADISQIIEIGPHSALRRPIKDTLDNLEKSGESTLRKRRKAGVAYASVLVRKRSSIQTTLELLGELYCSGYPVSVTAGNQQISGSSASSQAPALLADLPNYPFDHSHKYWDEPRLSTEHRLPRVVNKMADGSTALLGPRVPGSNELEPSWRTFLSSEALPWTGDHIINNTNLLAGTCMVSMAVEAARQNFHDSKGSGNYHIAGFMVKEVKFINTIVVGESIQEGVETILQMRPLNQNDHGKNSGQHEVMIYSCTKDSRWTKCFRCVVQVQVEDSGEVDKGLEKTLEEKRLVDEYNESSPLCTKPVDAAKFYDFLKTASNTRYGDAFALLEDIYWDGTEACIAHINLLASDSHRSLAGYPRHPVAAVLDAALHLTIVGQSNGNTVPSTRVLSGVKSIFLSSDLFTESSSSSVARVVAKAKKGTLGKKVTKCSSTGIDEHGAVLFSVVEVDMTAVDPPSDAEDGLGDAQDKKMIYGIDWKPQLSLMSTENLHEYMKNIPIDPEGEKFMKYFWPKVESALITVARRVLADDSIMGNTELPGYFKRQLSALSHYYRDESSSYAPAQAAKPLADAELESLLQDCEQEKPSWKLFSEVARNLAPILRGEMDALDTLFNSGLADQFYASFFDANYTPRFHAFLELASHQNRELKILEVGAGTGGMTRQALAALKKAEDRTGAASFSEYTYTDISPAFFESAKQQFHEFEDRMVFKTLDLESNSHEEEGFQAGEYDIILACSVIHATKDLHHTLSGLQKLLRPNGHLILLEITSPACACGNVGFGIHPGWWLSTEEWREHSPLIYESQWDTVLKETGFSGNHLTLRDYESDICHFSSIIVTKKVEQDPTVTHPGPLSHSILSLPTSSVSTKEKRRLALLIDSQSELQRTLAKSISERETSPTQVFAWHEEVEKSENSSLLAIASDPNVVVVSLLETSQPFLTRLSESSFYQLKRVVSGLKNLVWVTSTRTQDVETPFYKAMKGLIRVLRAEFADHYIVTLEIEAATNSLETIVDNLSGYVSTVIGESFTSSPGELEYIVKSGMLGTWRLMEDIYLNTKVNRMTHPTIRNGPWQEGQALELCVGTPGVLDSLHFIEDVAYQAELEPTDVEIEAKAWPLSFRDLLIALGRMDYQTPGFECAGVVTRVGSAANDDLSEGSTPFKPGDRVVMSLCRFGGSMRTYPRSNSINVYKIPDTLSLDDAASAVNPAMTAYHSLVNLARLQKGEKILIHSAAGSTGQMAVSIAQMIGAEIFATVGHDAKKTLLVEQFGIPADHVFYSRDTTFAQGVKRMTNGTGVDVVLNSLSGEALRASWSCIAPFGRFIELGKADIMSNASLPMLQFMGNTSFFGVDLFHVGTSNIPLYQSILRAVIQLLEDGSIQNPRPLHRYSITDIESAFRFMQSGKNTGRIIIKAEDDAQVPKLVRDLNPCSFKPDCSYLIIGGLGGIGRAIMRWMADNGAKNIITFSRSGLQPGATAARACVSELGKRGVSVYSAKCDVASAESLTNALQECAQQMPPIRGCINAAMDIYDAPFEGLSYDQWDRSLKSKVATSWNLHQQIPVGSVDFFILLASLVGIYGPIAQSNYAAGCTFQDAIASQRAEKGENAVSVDLGWMRSVGRVAEKEEYQKNRESQRDMKQVETEELLSILSFYCQPDNGQRRQVLLGGMTPADFLLHGEEPIPLLQRPMFTGFARSAATNNASSQAQSGESLSVRFEQASTPEEKLDIVVQAICARLARALDVPVDDIEPTKLLSQYGVDSLMAVELRNWIGKELAASVPVFQITALSIVALGELIVQKRSGA